MEPDCKVCEFVAGEPEGGWWWEDEHWRVGPHLTTEVPGWAVAYCRRHAAGLSDLNPGELASMGPVLSRVAAAIEAEVDAERVYLVLFGENVPHVHFVLMPRGSQVPPEHRSSRLHVNAKDYVDPAAYREVGRRIRRRLSEAPTR